jgi:hypothetical protein
MLVIFSEKQFDHLMKRTWITIIATTSSDVRAETLAYPTHSPEE